MLNCPFCKYEYDTEGIVDGRCPNCGSVVKWEQEGADADIDIHFNPMVTVSLGPQLFSRVPGLATPPPRAPDENGTGGSEGSRESAVPAPSGASGGSSGEGAGAAPTSAGPSSPDVGTEPAVPKAAKSTPASPSPPPPSQRSLSTDDVADLGQMWEIASLGTDTPLSTIRTTEKASPNRLNVVINDRWIQPKGKDEGIGADYELLDKIGQGAVGVVYAANQTSIDRQVAVKMLHGQTPATDEQRNKFLFEAIVTGDLDHPNIVPIHELGKNQQGDLFYSMKQIQGRPWSETLRERTLSENLSILMRVCDAIAFAHSRGIVHRDLKPENIMLGEFGEVLVVDWGIALPIEGFSKSPDFLSKPSISGTPAYMAPEMARGPLSAIGKHSDIYLLGAILYEMVTHKPPHQSPVIMDCVLAAARNEIAPVEAGRGPIAIAMKAMETEPSDRYGSVAEFQDAIRDYQSHEESIGLTERAQEILDDADRSREYQDYSRALFAFEEALSLWPENDAARKGTREANLRYAECALAKSDFELGLSLVDANDRSFEPVARSLKRGIEAREKRQSRIVFFRNAALFLVLFVIVGGTVALLFLTSAWQNAENARVDAENAKLAAESRREEAVSATDRMQVALGEAEKARNKANDLSLVAQSEAARAKAAETIAQEQRLITEQNLDRLAAANYVAAIGAVTQKVGQNAFSAAREVVARLAAETPALRHWEWGRLDWLCNGTSELILNAGQLTDGQTDFMINALDTCESVDASLGTPLLAMAGVQGEIAVLTGKGDQRAWRLLPFAEGAEATAWDVSFSPDGKYLAAAGSVAGQGRTAIWVVENLDQAPIVLPSHGSQVTSVTFLPEGTRLLTTSDDKTIRLWDWPEQIELQSYVGHLDTVWDCDYSPTRREIVSGSEDGTVRIWALDESSPRRRFSEHDGAVYQVAFSPDGDRVASAGADRRVLLWSVDPSSFREYGDDLEGGLSLVEVAQQNVDSIVRSGEDGERLRIASGRVRASSDTVVLGEHGNSVRVLQFSPEGSRLLSAGDDNLVKVWETAGDSVKGEAERLFRGHGSWVRGARFVADAEGVFSGGYDQEVRFWDLAEFGDRDVTGEREAISATDLSPDGKTMGVAGEDGTARIYDLTGTRAVMELKEGHEFLSTSAILSPKGDRLITAAGDNSVRIWDYGTGTQLRSIADTGRRSLLAMSGDGSRFATGMDGERGVRVFATATGDEVVALESAAPAEAGGRSPDVTAMALSADGKLAIAGDSFGVCYLWDLEQGGGLLGPAWKAHFGGVVDAQFLQGADGEVRFLTAGREGVVAQWTLAAAGSGEADRSDWVELGEQWGLRKTILSAPGAVPLTNVWVSESHRLIALVKHRVDRVTRETDAILEVIQLDDGRMVQQAEFPGTRLQAITDEPGPLPRFWLAARKAGEETTIFRWNPIEEPRPEPWLAGMKGKNISQISITPHDRQLMTVGGKGVQVWNLANGAPIRQFRAHGRLECIRLSADGRSALTGGVDRAVKLWDLQTGQARLKFEHPQLGVVTAVAYAPGAEIVLVGDDRGQLFRWDTNADRVVDDGPWVRQGGRINAIAVQPGSGAVATASEDRQVVVWDWETGDSLQTYPHGDRVLTVAFSSDGSLLLTGTGDNLGVVWETRGGNRIATLPGHAAPISSAVFSKDTMRVLTASQDGTASLWDLSRLLEELNSPEGRGEVEVEKLEEIFTLPSDGEELVSAGFAMQGRDIVTTSRGGRVHLWRGASILPSIRLSRGAMSLRGDGRDPLDPAAMIVSPIETSFDGATLEIRLAESTGLPPEEAALLALDLAPQFLQAEEGWELSEDRVLRSREGEIAPSLVGTLLSGPGKELKIGLEPGASLADIERLIRATRLEGVESVLEAGQVTVEFAITWPEESSPTPARLKVQFVGTKQIETDLAGPIEAGTAEAD